MASSGPQYNTGLHVGEIVSHNLGKASTGTPQIVLRVKILGLPKTDGTFEPFSYQNERTIFMSLTEKTVDFVVEQLQSIPGFSCDSLDQLDPENPKAIDLKGTQVDLWCKHEKDQKGELRERWNISSPREIVTEKLNSKEIRQLNTLFGKALKKSAPAPKTAAKSTPAKQQSDAPPIDAYENTVITDDDLPDNMQEEESEIPF